MALKKWQEVIDIDFPDLPQELLSNKILDIRRKRLDELSRLEEKEYQRYLKHEESEHPINMTLRWMHYAYGAYEILDYLLN